MLEAIKRFFDDNLRDSPADAPEAAAHRLRLATAALLVEVARADHHLAETERRHTAALLRERFDLPEAEIEALLALAEQEVDEAIDYYQFTSLINREFQPEEKVALLEQLWSVAFADGRLDRYEEHTVRRVADLLHVPHSDFIAAKLRITGE